MKQLTKNHLLAICLCLLTSYTLIAQNLIPNPGFEAGTGKTFTNWSIFNEISGTFSEAVAPGEFRSGSRALKGQVTQAGQAWQLQLASDLIPTQSGEEYTFSIWVKGANAGTPIRFSSQPNALYSADYTVSTEWTQLTWTFTANEEMTRIVLDIGAQVNTYYLDDMSLRGPAGGAANCQLLDNGDFEMYNPSDSIFTGWAYFNQNGGSSFGVATGDNAYDGNSALRAINAGGIARWGLQVGTPAFPTVNGQTYTLNIWIKARVPNANFIQFSTRDGNAANEGQYTNSASRISGDWTMLSYTFTAISDATVITLNLGDETANTYYIDDICVVYPETTDNCLPLNNNGFETHDTGSNTFSSWTYYNRENGSSFGVTMDTSKVYSGSNALVARTATNTLSYQLQMASPSFYTLSGGTYRFKIWIKADSANVNTIQFSLRNAASPFNSEAQYTTSASTIGKEWMQVTYEFKAFSPRSLVTLNLGGSVANTYYIDEVCLEVVCGTSYSAPATQVPIASGKSKFLGNVYAGHALPDFEKYFNQVTPENSGKWASVEVQRDSFNWTALDQARQFAKNQNFPFRFHVMVWGAQQPAWLENLPQAEQVEEIKEWFAAVSTRYSGENAPEYLEVVNEPLNQPPFYKAALSSLNTELNTAAGEYDWIVNAFKLGRQYFSAQTKLMINEYGIENTPGLNGRYADIIRLLKVDGLVDVVGMQGHTFSTRKYGGTYTALNNNLKSNLDNLAQLGLPIQITELDIEGDMYFDANGEPQDGGTTAQKDSFQLSEYQRIFDIYWNHPSVIGITLWGWRPGLWQNDAAAYLLDPCTGQERPALQWLNTAIRASSPPVNIPTSLKEIESSIPLRVYPTVVQNELTIEGLAQNRGLVQVFDLNGRLVKSFTHPLNDDRIRVNVGALPRGMYIVRAGRAAQKIIKQ
ncbi:endo-1,4-beta-xylanase [Haliscomenobacter sp.]|uniref:endo-1,4-beta-xylanase n=1 Tax=Haliscomenobacter sp. TaxID=2717303 RepID=UPI0035939552